MAALEQWEIDLRNQLGDMVNTKQKNKTSQGPSLEKVVRDRLNGGTVNTNKFKPKKNSNNSLLIFVLIFLGLALTGAWAWKNGKLDFLSSTTKQPIPNVPLNDKTTVVKNYDAEIAALKVDMEKMKANQKAMGDKVKWNSDRLNLMGLVINENCEVVRNGSTSFIYFNRDWTLSKEPQYIQLSDEDKEYLKKFVTPIP